MAIFITSTATG